MIRTKCWCKTKQSHKSNKDKILNYVFVHRKDDNKIFPLTVKEIALAQKKDKSIQKNKPTYERKLVENTYVLCKDGWLVIPSKLQYRAIAWYHHYLQHPGHTRLEETLKQAMYWTDMRSSIRQFVKQCKSCHPNLYSRHKIPCWEALCVDLIGPYSINDKDGSVK